MKIVLKIAGTYFLLVGILSFTYGQSKKVDLTFHPEKYTTQTAVLNDNQLKVRAYENIVYVESPLDTAYQKLNIYIPEAYFEGKTINGYTAATAPIFFPNRVGGYAPAQPATFLPNAKGGGPFGMNPDGKRQSSVQVALANGYVVASAGARGRFSISKDQTFIGKAPAGLVDLKAAIRYLKFNDKNMPGDASKIISNGTSAGGAMSTLLGATGNNSDFEPYLKALGAAKATDDIFAVSAYCPITNLDHSDMAYEWQFQGIHTYTRGGPPGMNGNQQKENTLSKEQIAVSEELKTFFPAYLNQLKLKNDKGELLTLDAQGNGNFKELVNAYVMASAQKAISNGADLSSLTWITIENGKVTQLDFNGYLNYLGRQKTPPAFDALDLSTPENQLFGTSSVDKQHFTDYGINHSSAAGKKSDLLPVKMMNPMNYIGQPKTKTSKHWRIRHGSKDKDTSLAISVILATTLANNGYAVDLAFPWDVRHSGDYDLDALTKWIDGICKK
jgi:hypothetical protein